MLQSSRLQTGKKEEKYNGCLKISFLKTEVSGADTFGF